MAHSHAFRLEPFVTSATVWQPRRRSSRRRSQPSFGSLMRTSCGTFASTSFSAAGMGDDLGRRVSIACKMERLEVSVSQILATKSCDPRGCEYNLEIYQPFTWLLACLSMSCSLSRAAMESQPINEIGFCFLEISPAHFLYWSCR